jgi:hypothetical protein
MVTWTLPPLSDRLDGTGAMTRVGEALMGRASVPSNFTRACS